MNQLVTALAVPIMVSVSLMELVQSATAITDIMPRHLNVWRIFATKIVVCMAIAKIQQTVLNAFATMDMMVWIAVNVQIIIIGKTSSVWLMTRH